VGWHTRGGARIPDGRRGADGPDDPAGLLVGPDVPGELRPGLDADLVAFSADPLTCPVDELPGIEIRLTLLGGRAVHDPGAVMEEERR
jgi:hypothetical protein